MGDERSGKSAPVEKDHMDTFFGDIFHPVIAGIVCLGNFA